MGEALRVESRCIWWRFHTVGRDSPYMSQPEAQVATDGPRQRRGWPSMWAAGIMSTRPGSGR